MDDVIIVDLSTGKTLPFRPTTAKSGNRFWGILQQLKDGSRKFAGYGVNVAQDVTGHPDEIKTISIPAGGIVAKAMTVAVKHDLNDKGKARATADEQFTGTDGQKWKVSFRATLTDAGIVNVKGAVNRVSSGFGGPRVQSSL